MIDLKKHPHPLSLIVAFSENLVIGKQQNLPWHLSADLKHFKEVTWDQRIIMGRKTFESIGRILPHREHWVLSHDAQGLEKSHPGLHGVSQIGALWERLDLARTNFVIGGAQIYQTLLPWVGKMFITRIHQEIEGDAYFPSLDWRQWECTRSSTHREKEISFSFQEYTRVV